MEEKIWEKDKTMTQSQKFKICNNVILHWQTNLFLAKAKELDRNDISDFNCKFCLDFSCDIYLAKSKACPLLTYNKSYDCSNTPWRDIRDGLAAVSKEETIPTDSNKVYSPKYINEYWKEIADNTEKFLELLEKVCDKWLNDAGEEIL